MSMNIETPPGWRADTAPTDVIEEKDLRIRGRLQQTSGEFLLCRLLAKIIQTGTLHMQMPSGRTHTFGAGEPVVTIRLTTAHTVWRVAAPPGTGTGRGLYGQHAAGRAGRNQ